MNACPRPTTPNPKKSWKLFYKIIQFSKDIHYTDASSGTTAKRYKPQKSSVNSSACGKELVRDFTWKNLLFRQAPVTACTCEAMQVTKNLRTLYTYAFKVLTIVLLSKIIPQYGKDHNIDCLFVCQCGCGQKSEPP